MLNMYALSFSFYSPIGFGSNDLVFTQRKDISWAAFSKAQYEVQLQRCFYGREASTLSQ